MRLEAICAFIESASARQPLLTAFFAIAAAAAAAAAAGSTTAGEALAPLPLPLPRIYA